MYRYDEFDAQFVSQRVKQFRGQVERRLDGSISEEEFRPLRLMNGLYLQLHAYMLRVAIPYGTLSSTQMRKLAYIADTYDKGYGHFTTRQNIQYNWPKLEDAADILSHLAEVEMHAIQTSGNCIRNVTSDQWAGVAVDEIEDPRPVSELLRQWSSLHPEFSYLPRKFKIAVTGAPNDRAAVKFHDIGLIIRRNDAGEIGYEVLAGGGLGRTPMIAITVREWVSKAELLPYLTAIMRVYNLHGRRDNKYKARIKILVHELGADKFREEVEAEYAKAEQSEDPVSTKELARIEAYFAPPAYETYDGDDADFVKLKQDDDAFASWAGNSLTQHRVPGYAIVNISLKPHGGIPGDASADQMRVVAELADDYSFGEIRVTHEQNLVLPYVPQAKLYELWQKLCEAKLATANIGLVSDMICCPGLDYCALATARSIPIAQEISSRFEDTKREQDIGPLKIKMSGCINACGHHHVGHIGILGLDRKGVENYQITLGGSGDEDAAIGKIIGPGFSKDEIAGAIEKIVEAYIGLREGEESFLETYKRLGIEPFKEAVYATH